MTALKRLTSGCLIIIIPYLIWWVTENAVEGLFSFIALGCLAVCAVYYALKEFSII